MNIRDWMEGRKISVIQMSFLMKCTRGHLHHVLQGKKNPSDRFMLRVYQITDGQVSKREEMVNPKD